MGVPLYLRISQQTSGTMTMPWKTMTQAGKAIDVEDFGNQHVSAQR
jgi:hypothetical protein